MSIVAMMVAGEPWLARTRYSGAVYSLNVVAFMRDRMEDGAEYISLLASYHERRGTSQAAGALCGPGYRCTAVGRGSRAVRSRHDGRCE